MSKKVFRTDIRTTTDISTLKAILKIYLATYELNHKVKVRLKLVDTLAVYMKYGVTKESDQMLADMSGVPITNVRVHKSELRKLGLLEKSEKNLRISSLKKDLVDLVDLFEKTHETNDFLYVVTFNNLNNK